MAINRKLRSSLQDTRVKRSAEVESDHHLVMIKLLVVKKVNPMYRIVLNLAKSYILSCLSKFYNKKNFSVPFLKYKRLKLKLRVFLAGHSVAMVTYCVTKIIPTCMFTSDCTVLDTMIEASIDKEW